MKYAPADLEAIVSEIEIVNEFEKEKLLKLLHKFDHLFDGTLVLAFLPLNTWLFRHFSVQNEWQMSKNRVLCLTVY